MNSIEFFALSQAQLRLIPSEIQDPGTTAYTISKRYVFSDIATDDLVQRIANAISSAMRIRLHQNDDGDVVQYVGEAPIVDIIDMSEASESDIESMRNERLYAVFPEIFDVPLVKLTLMVLPEGRHELLAVFHHAIADGTTTIHFGERIESASAYDNGEYRSYVEAEYDYLNSEACKADVEWWANALELYSDSIVNDLPLAEGEGCLADTIDIRFTADETAAINNAIGKISGQRISPFVFTSAMLSVYLSRIYGNPQTVLSTAFNTREKDMRQCDGMFVNLLAIPYSYSPDKSLTDLLVDTKTTLKDGLSHGRCPFNVYANELTRRGRDVESIIRYNVVSNSGESKTIRAVEHYESHLPLTVRVNYNLSDKAGLQLITLEYQTAAFTNEQMENMAFQMKTMIMYAVNHPDLPCGEWKMPLSDAEMARLANFNRTECEYDNTQTIPSLFRKAAAMYPDNDCVVYDGRHYSYKEVDELSDNIAWMIHERGIGREQVVSVLIPRCEYMAIASLGIVKAGAAYQPLDPTYPEERLNFMMKDADARLLICDRSLRAKVNEYQGDILYIDEIQATVPRSFASGLPLSPLPSSLFILLYTSGSTGTPKGCQIEQRNIVAFCHWYQREYQLTSESRASAYASYGFDANMMDTWPALTIGASVHIISEDLRMNLVALNDYFEHNGITHCLMTTQIGRQFATEIDNHSLLHLNVGGEKLVPCNPPKNYMLHNAYGPTEGTIVATSFIVDRLYANVPIGRPVDNMKAYVIDKQKHLLPVGAAGELCISGPQISRGYLNRPEQTAKAYEPNPFSNEDGYERIYHTGDIVRWLPDGNIEFVGRKDAQVKIRGFRIELTEVEAVVREYPQIKDATVQAFDAPGGGKFICAYIVSDEKVDVQSLNAFIQERKPPYMVPAVTMQIDKIPLNQNQKVNKKALPTPELKQEETTSSFVAPKTDLQKTICDIYSEVLGLERVGITDNFFLIGGTSILAIKVAMKCMLKGLHVVYSEIFQYAMPAELAAYLEGKEVNDSASSSVEVATDSDKEESETTVDQPWRKALVYNNSEHVGLLDITPTHTYLLTGATGFLGVHILNYIIENTDATVYCLVRKGSFDSPEERLEGICFYYFNKSYADLVGKRIFCIDGEIDNKTLVDSLADLPFDTLINAAAIVKHFSNDDSLERVNVEGVRYLAEMCLRAGRRITHVSTLSVGGLNVDNAVDINRKFYESDLFFGQDTTYNVYVDTKSRGEEALLNLVPSGLKGKIVRVGNLMSRNDDGEFQINFNTNGFMRTLRGYTTLGCCPVSLADKEYEFSPIDAVAKAIVMLSDTNPEFTVFHIYNRHRVHLIDIIQMLNDMGMKIDMVEDNVFQQHLMKAFENGADDKIGGLVSYKSKASKHILRPIEWNSDFTTKVLYRLGFTWPITGHGYIHNAIDAVRSLGFFD